MKFDDVIDVDSGYLFDIEMSIDSEIFIFILFIVVCLIVFFLVGKVFFW